MWCCYLWCDGVWRIEVFYWEGLKEGLFIFGLGILKGVDVVILWRLNEKKVKYWRVEFLLIIVCDGVDNYYSYSFCNLLDFMWVNYCCFCYKCVWVSGCCGIVFIWYKMNRKFKCIFVLVYFNIWFLLIVYKWFFDFV